MHVYRVQICTTTRNCTTLNTLFCQVTAIPSLLMMTKPLIVRQVRSGRRGSHRYQEVKTRKNQKNIRSLTKRRKRSRMSSKARKSRSQRLFLLAQTHLFHVRGKLTMLNPPYKHKMGSLSTFLNKLSQLNQASLPYLLYHRFKLRV